MKTGYVLEVIDPVEREDGTHYVNRHTYADREEAWAKYAEALRCGFEASIEEVGRPDHRTKVRA